jgi:hypothetical protein
MANVFNIKSVIMKKISLFLLFFASITNFNAHADEVCPGYAPYAVIGITTAGVTETVSTAISGYDAIVDCGSGSIINITNTGSVTGSRTGFLIPWLEMPLGDPTGVINNEGSITGPTAIQLESAFGKINNGSAVGSTASITSTDYAINTQGGEGLGLSELNNYGTISGGIFGVINSMGTPIGLIDNWGTINGGATGNGIYNNGTITTLNNLQGGDNPLDYAGTLPVNYNIIISDGSFGRLSVGSEAYYDGITTFGIDSRSVGIVSSSIYTSVITGVSSSNLASVGTNALSGIALVQGTYLTRAWALYQTTLGGTTWNLCFDESCPDFDNFVTGPSLADTQASLNRNAAALRGVFAGQYAIINNALSYDCTTFDTKGICVSAGGRVTDTNNPSTNSRGALLIASYRANQQWRIGGYLDQNLSSNDANGINLENNNPMAGIFAVWNQNNDGTGYEMRLSAGYSDKDVTVTRSIASTEAGKGDSAIKSQAYSAILSRGFLINHSRWIASPYLGMRYTKIKRDGYSEELSGDSPLSYSSLSQETTTALAGLRLNGRVGDKVSLMLSAGIENDIAHHTGSYSASGMDGLSSINFNQNIRHVRPVAQISASYLIGQRQSVGANLLYRQEVFNSTHSVSGMINYQIGF